MITVDVIMLTKTISEDLQKMTQKAIDTLHNSERDFEFNVILLESNKKSEYIFNNCKVYTPDFKHFNYNRYMNYGLCLCENDYVVLANNDLVFYKNWFSEIYKHKDEAHSFSPWNEYEDWHTKLKKIEKTEFNEKGFKEGYRTSYEMTGWCFVVKKEIFEWFKLDERVEFWYSDNVYIDDLQKHNFKHILVRDSKVDHLCSKTTEKMDKEKQKLLTTGQFKKYKKKND